MSIETGAGLQKVAALVARTPYPTPGAKGEGDGDLWVDRLITVEKIRGVLGGQQVNSAQNSPLFLPSSRGQRKKTPREREDGGGRKERRETVTDTDRYTNEG